MPGGGAVEDRKSLAALPSVDRLLRDPACQPLIASVGRALTTDAVRQVVDDARAALAGGAGDAVPATETLLGRARERAEALMVPSLRPVFNLTGTVIHTNLGRAPLPEEAVAAIAAVASRPANLEYDLGAGRRGDRDAHLEAWVCRLTGAEAATVVNNNAAAVLLVLNSLAQRREAIVSRGELIEIGGSFRLPDIMKRAGTRLVEVGTTNRTHARDYREAIGRGTALILRAHTSNYEVQGFTAAVPDPVLAGIASEAELPYVVDLGSGTLVDLERFGLPHEPTVRETLEQGADLVTFSGDKLLGGPQAGVIAGRGDLIGKIKANPMRRALRIDKLTTAALEAVLRLYADPDRLADRIPVLRFLTRDPAEIEAVAHRLVPLLKAALEGVVTVSAEACRSQIGSGAMPVEAVESMALVLRPAGPRKRAGAAAKKLAEAFRALPVPVIGRVADNALHLDLRCLEDEAEFIAQLDRLPFAGTDAR